jgi:hypothetical protein
MARLFPMLDAERKMLSMRLNKERWAAEIFLATDGGSPGPRFPHNLVRQIEGV